jgi:N6-adenosine-specific RNA methylase IME4
VVTRRKCVETRRTAWLAVLRPEFRTLPDAILDMIEQVSPGPYLELFARRARFGWDYWGDESLGTAEMLVV